MTLLFRYAPEIIERYPNVMGGVIHAPKITNSPTSAALADLYLAEQRAVTLKLGDKALSELPSLAAWRAAFRKFGVDPTQYRSAAESLLRRLTKKGDIPTINTLVDIGNLVSIRYALPVAIFDLGGIAGGIDVRFSDGRERFTPLESPEPEAPEAGEVVFADSADRACARRWCWRQSKESAASADTTTVLITVEAHQPDGRHDIEAALADLSALLDQFAPGPRTTGIVDATTPGFAVE